MTINTQLKVLKMLQEICLIKFMGLFFQLKKRYQNYLRQFDIRFL